MRILVFFLLLFSQAAFAENLAGCPDLASVEHVSGRLATKEDIDAGAAIFMLQVEGTRIGEPIDIAVPQYAIQTESASGNKMAVVIVQAEETEDQKIIGALGCKSDEFSLGLLEEFELRGTTKP